ncbi:hypothetical protein NUACC26_088400 [Scytonema sp. NUACC26]
MSLPGDRLQIPVFCFVHKRLNLTPILVFLLDLPILVSLTDLLFALYHFFHKVR